MQATPRRNGFVILAFIAAMLVIVTLAFSGTTWAAPGAQGTVPTPPNPTSVGPTGTSPTSVAPTDVPPPDDNGGGNGNDNGGDNGGNNDGGNNDGGNNSGSPTSVPSAAGTGTVCAIGDAGAQCAANDLSIIVGAGAANAGSALTIEGSFPQPPCPSTPSGQVFLNRCYRYTWIGTDAQPLSAINGAVQYCISYGPAELAAVKNDPSAFLMGVAGTNGAWTMLKPTADPAGGRTCATTNQLVVWSGLFGPQTVTDLLPTVGGTQDYVWLAASAALGILLFAGALRLRKN